MCGNRSTKRITINQCQNEFGSKKKKKMLAIINRKKATNFSNQSSYINRLDFYSISFETLKNL